MVLNPRPPVHVFMQVFNCFDSVYVYHKDNKAFNWKKFCIAFSLHQYEFGKQILKLLQEFKYILFDIECQTMQYTSVYIYINIDIDTDIGSVDILLM